MSLQQRYAQDLEQHGFTPDPAQQQAINALHLLAQKLNQQGQTTVGLVSRWMRRNQRVPGIYLWGGVGRGKTYLMDLFYDSLQGIGKQRVHYHKFMLGIHEQLRALSRSPDPLTVIGKSIARQNRVLCLDEFHVTDVADAMLLSGLLRAMFKNGITLVVTSNTRIDDLYLNGLQRDRFMQAITLLHDCTVEIDIEPGQDYRLLHLSRGETYFTLSASSLETLAAKFKSLAPGEISDGVSLTVYGRAIRTVALSDDVVWFDFHELCDTPRAAKDYLEIACLFHTVFVTNIPVLGDAQDSAAKRFMHLIDALYDHRVKLIVSAELPPADLYQGRLLKGAFDRTVSRLIEMGSADYLALAHKL